MNKIKGLEVAVIALSLLSVAGCGISKDKYSEYLNMQADYSKINYEYTTDYTEAIMFIANHSELSKDKMASELKKYKETITNNMILSMEIQAEKDKNSEETQVSPASPEDVGVDDGTNIVPEEHPIYGKYLSVEGYGTYEESLASLRELDNMTTNSIVTVDKYKDYLVVKLDNKYTGEFLMTFTIKDNKLDSYTTYWR